MTIRAVVFDIGGVLEITPDLGVNAKWEQQLGLKPGELGKLLKEVFHAGSIGTISIEKLQEKIGEILEINETRVLEFMEDIWHEYLGTLNVELVEYFCHLRPDYQTAMISNSFIGAREKEEEAYRFSEVCDFIIYSHEVGMSKPDPAIYRLACERLGLLPSEIIFVDDHEETFVSAQAMGIHCILFKDNAQIIADIEACIQSNQE